MSLFPPVRPPVLHRVVTYIFRPDEKGRFGLLYGYCVMSMRPANALELYQAQQGIKGRVHRLKTLEPFFTEVWMERKTHELRVDDREPRFEVGDVLELVLEVPF